MQLFLHKTICYIHSFFKNLSKEAFTLLKIGLPIISASLITFSFYMVEEAEKNPANVMTTYPQLLEHILASLLLLLFGAFFFDVISKKK